MATAEFPNQTYPDLGASRRRAVWPRKGFREISTALWLRNYVPRHGGSRRTAEHVRPGEGVVLLRVHAGAHSLSCCPPSKEAPIAIKPARSDCWHHWHSPAATAITTTTTTTDYHFITSASTTAATRLLLRNNAATTATSAAVAYCCILYCLNTNRPPLPSCCSYILHDLHYLGSAYPQKSKNNFELPEYVACCCLRSFLRT